VRRGLSRPLSRLPLACELLRFGYRIAAKRSRIAALPASIIAAGSRPICLYSPGLRRAACARMMAARCGPRRANRDAMLKARGQSPTVIAACTCESLVCKTASCGGRLYTERGRTSRRDKGVFSPHIRPDKAKGAFWGGRGQCRPAERGPAFTDRLLPQCIPQAVFEFFKCRISR
jgi:hypothetical protein